MAGETRVLTFAEGVSVEAPPQTFLIASSLSQYASDADFVTAKGSAAAQGDIYLNTTDGKIHYYDTSWQVITTDFIGINEYPSGTINGVNKDFSLNYTLITGTLHVLIDGIDMPNDTWSLSYPVITFVDAPVLGKKVEAKYLSSGASATLSLGTIERKVETHLVTSGEISDKKITLQQTPADPTEVTVSVRGGAPQAYGYDFEIINDNELSWNGLGLDGQIIAGSILVIIYYF